MHNLRWKLYKTLCWIAFWICPPPERLVLGVIWERKLDAFCREVETREVVECEPEQKRKQRSDYA